ncbi:MAG: pseudouridine synthase [bacterium]
MPAIRLQKIIAQAGVASRREAERLIAQGRVSLNGQVVTEPGTKADPALDAVKVDGKLITRRETPVYLVLNKPRNVLTTMRDEEGKDRPTVADLLPSRRRRVFPVGRLDFDVEGVLILTNDGELAHRLAHPRYEVPRIYEAKVKGAPGDRALKRLDRMAGDETGGGAEKKERPRVSVLARKAEKNTWLRINLREGKHHQVKKMCEAVSHPVIKLVRRSFGGITTRGLPRGGVRPLTDEEVLRLKVMTRLATSPKDAAARRATAGRKTGRKARSSRG